MKHYLSRVRLFQTGNHPQDRRLTASRRAQQYECLTFGYIKRDVFKDTGFTKALAHSNDTCRLERCNGVRLRFSLFFDQLFFSLHKSSSIHIEPVAGEEKHAEDQKRKECQNNSDRVRGFNLAFIELGKDI